MDDSEWRLKGATLSDTSAQEEYGLTSNEIYQAMSDGTLQFREGSMYGNPWFRLLRREVEAMVKKLRGAGYLKEQLTKTELARISSELRKLKTRMNALEKRKAELTGEPAGQSAQPAKKSPRLR